MVRFSLITLVFAVSAWAQPQTACARRVLLTALGTGPIAVAQASLSAGEEIVFTYEPSSPIQVYYPKAGRATPVQDELPYLPELEDKERLHSLRTLKTENEILLFARTDRQRLFRTRMVPHPTNEQAPKIGTWELVADHVLEFFAPITADSFVEMDTNGSLYWVENGHSRWIKNMGIRATSMVASLDALASSSPAPEHLTIWAVGRKAGVFTLFKSSISGERREKLDQSFLPKNEVPYRLIPSGNTSFAGTLLKTAFEEKGEAQYRLYEFNGSGWTRIDNRSADDALGGIDGPVKLPSAEESAAMMKAHFRLAGLFGAQPQVVAWRLFSYLDAKTEQRYLGVRNIGLLAHGLSITSQEALFSIRDADLYEDPRVQMLIPSGQVGSRMKTYPPDHMQWIAQEGILGLSRAFPEYMAEDIREMAEDALESRTDFAELAYWELLDYLYEKLSQEREIRNSNQP